ncbi:MAG: hypothetical protein Q7S21_01545 [archaeon]|nr:hypothetical protein [archaeon]
MGLYDKEKPKQFSYDSPKFSFDFEKYKIPLMFLGAIILIGVVFLLFASQVEFNPISIEFEEQPMRIDFQKSIIVQVNARNIFPQTVSNTQIKIVPITNGLIVFPSSVQIIPAIPTANHGTASFNVTTNNYAKGNYEFKAIVSMNNQVFEKTFTLQVV